MTLPNNNCKTDSCDIYFNSLKDRNTGRLRCKKFTLTRGDTLQSTHPKYDGFAFTIGVTVEKSIECVHVWIIAEKTYLGFMLKELGYEWVLLKKHAMIPRKEMIELKYLCNSVKISSMKPEDSICYEEDSSSSFAYYFVLGDQLVTNRQMTKPPKVLDLCAGGGGISVGLQNVGFNVKYKVCPE